MKYFNGIIILAAITWSAISNAQEIEQEIEIGVPDGWVATKSGIAKANSELSVGPVLDLEDETPASYLAKLANRADEGIEIKSIGEIKNGAIVAQVVREITKEGNKARSTFFICKGGRNKHRLLELYTDNVFSVISGGKAAIAFCDQQ